MIQVHGCPDWAPEPGEGQPGCARAAITILFGSNASGDPGFIELLFGCLCLGWMGAFARLEKASRMRQLQRRSQARRNEVGFCFLAARLSGCLCTRWARLKASCSQPNGTQVHPTGQVGAASPNQSRPVFDKTITTLNCRWPVQCYMLVSS